MLYIMFEATNVFISNAEEKNVSFLLTLIKLSETSAARCHISEHTVE